jgi:hypothetical protein
VAVYEKRTYDVVVGQMAIVIELYSTQGYPALQAGGFDKHLVGYFTSDTGPLNQLIHIWKFEDDAERRDFWKRLFADEVFMGFAGQLRPNIRQQEIQLMLPAPWGEHP